MITLVLSEVAGHVAPHRLTSCSPHPASGSFAINLRSNHAHSPGPQWPGRGIGAKDEAGRPSLRAGERERATRGPLAEVARPFAQQPRADSQHPPTWPFSTSRTTRLRPA